MNDGGKNSDRSMAAVYSIDELYSKVRDYDLVLCNDAPLATAINNRVDRAVLGSLAVTPRQLAAKLAVEVTGRTIVDDIVLARSVAEDTGYSLKYVHGEIENFKNAFRVSSSFDGRLSRRSANVFRYYSKYNTLENVMLNFDSYAESFYKGKNVAVIGLDLFDNLDKHMLPMDFDDIPLEDDSGRFSVDSMYILGNDRIIADCAVDIVRRCGPNDVAIVLDTSGPIADAVKSVLYHDRIPFINSLEVRDLGSIRNFLEFTRLALSYSTVLVRDVRDIFSAYRGSIHSKYDRYYLSKFRESSIKKGPNTEKLLDLMADAKSMTFTEFMKGCVPADERSSVTMLLEQMDCADRTVSQSVLDDLVYAVNSIAALKHNEQIVESEKKGVLLVDCRNSVYIDRPVIVYTGMCSEWESDLGHLDYIDPKVRPDLEERNERRFRALIQQGSVRFYLVNATKEGKDAVPCKYFDKCIHGESYFGDSDAVPMQISSFSDICTSEPIRRPWKTERRDRSVSTDSSMMKGCPEACPAEFSNSSYMNYLRCPRAFMYSRLTDSSDNTSTYTGSRIHDFAELRISYPDMVKEKTPEYFADMIAEECAQLSSPDLMDIEHSRISAEIAAIDGLIETLKVQPGKLIPRTAQDDNHFYTEFGLNETSEHTEHEFRSRESAMKGRVDFLWNGSVFDWKTGNSKSMSDVMRELDLRSMKSGSVASANNTKTCQALFYLCLLNDCGIENNRRFSLFFAQDAYNQQLANKPMDTGSCLRSVQLVDSLESEIDEGGRLSGIFPSSYSMVSPHDVYSICADIAGPDTSQWMVDGKPREDLVDAVKGIRCIMKDKPGQYGSKNAVSAIKKICSTFDGGMAVCDDAILVSQESVDRFRARLIDDLENVRIYYEETFPADPCIDCRKCHFRDLCTEEKVWGGEMNVSE